MTRDEAETLARIYPYSVDEIVELSQIIDRYILENELKEINMLKVLKVVMDKAVVTQISCKAILGYMMGLWK